MAPYGQISAYIEGEEDFDTYTKRVKNFFIANGVEKEKKLAIFLTVIGPKVYKLLASLILPKEPENCSFEEVVKCLANHYKAERNPIYERFVFYRCNQNMGESISNYVARIKALAGTCEFNENLEEMLRDRFIQGINNSDTQHLLLTDKTMTFQKAVDLARSRETATKEIAGFSQPLVEVNRIHNSTHKSSVRKTKPPMGQSNANIKPSQPCSGCGGMHWKKDCQFKNAECFHCHRKGHLAKCCRVPKNPNKSNNYGKAVNTISVVESAGEYEEIFQINNNKIPPIMINIKINGTPVKMELDTGAARSIMPKAIYEQTWPIASERPMLQKCNVKLETYGGTQLNVVGEITVKITRMETSGEHQASLIVVQDTGPHPCLLGRDLITKLQINPLQINAVSVQPNWVKKFSSLFAPGLGCFKGKKVKIEVDPTVPPKYCKARTVPYAMREKVDQELTRLEETGIISPVTHSPWAAAIVPVAKSDPNEIRICGDFKLTVNRAARLDTYPIPSLSDLFNSIGGGKVFTKLDMSQAYAQLELDEESKLLTVINTQKGLFQYNRLCFGVSSAPGIFQRCMEDLLKGLPGVFCYLDDILVAAPTLAEHNTRVEAVLQRLQDSGLKLKSNKCHFASSEVNYLGYKLDAEGLHPTAEKVKAIVDAPAPVNITQLRAYLGLLNFYRRFLPQAASLLEPLNKLLRAKEEWSWGKEQEQAFQKSKDVLVGSSVLMHFDLNKPIVVVADSSAYGIGAVLCHKVNGVEHPVCFASRTLNSAERNYSQLEKEALALVYALTQFHKYLWGQPEFTLVTDHKPLLGLFLNTKSIPQQASGRIQRWALLLQSYKFTLIHRSGAVLGTADALSRLPLPVTHSNQGELGEWKMLVNFLETSPVTSRDISAYTLKDPILSKVLKNVQMGWSSESLGSELLVPYARRRDELSTQAGCVLWGARVIIPEQLRSRLLNELHSQHTGASKMKELARSYFWWPNLDKEIENTSNSCPECLQIRKSPSKAELHPWEWPSTPWHRLHVDYAGPTDGKYYLIVVDAHSKWVEIIPTTGTTAKETISGLRHVFSRFGLPVSIVSDNGPCFTSEEFGMFTRFCGLRHIKSAVYKPATNGLAERMVQTFKRALKSSRDPVPVFLDKFLFKYRMTPHSTTGISPAELLLGRKLRNRLDLLWPMSKIASNVSEKQEHQRRWHTNHPREVDWKTNDPVMVKSFARLGPKWTPAAITECTGPVSYKCELEDGRIIKRHQDQIHSRDSPAGEILENPDQPEPDFPQLSEKIGVPKQTSGNTQDVVHSSPNNGNRLRRSSRHRKPTLRLDL